MAGCSCGNNLDSDGISVPYKRILWVIIAINALMFLVEVGGSMAADSMALRADALDFLGDSLTYGITLLAIGHPIRWRASAALFKGLTLALMGFWVLGSTLYRVFILGVPNETIMGSIALMAFAANATSVVLLVRYRNGDANVRSVWLCSRNDAIGNLAVMVAAGVVYYTQSRWPDLLVAAGMALLFLHSSTLIIRQARRELREDRTTTAQYEGCADRCEQDPRIANQMTGSSNQR
ncbi:cation transporter [Sedimenticola selenatireducens]|uniref:Cation transporter n=1 Tax=Sedimenticola selenatireducens TaxID=191960 RepID=A0A2N6CTD2_9GAMM|nr:cation transporter [Sedimenticola selenatireducens]PLX60381.1 MAG: cation transporter [Sedimenticola selenatireducens]